MKMTRCRAGLLVVILGAGWAAGAAEEKWWEPQKAKAPIISGPIYRVLESNKWGYIDQSGAMVIPPAYDSADDLSEGRARVVLSNEFFILKDDGGLIQSEDLRSPFREGRAFVGTGGGGAIKMLDENGKVILDGIRDFEPFSDGWALVVTNAGWVYVDRTGKLVLDLTNTVHTAREQRSGSGGGWPTKAYPFANGRSRVYMAHEKWAYIDKSGKIAIPARFERAYDFAEGFARVRLDGKWGYIKPDGSFAVEPRFEDARDYADGMAAVMLGGKWGYLDQMGKQAIAPQFDEPQRFQEGMALIRENGKTGFMDKQGKVVIKPTLDGAREFKNGLAMVWVATRRGYINPKGEFVYVYDTLFGR